VCCQAQHGPTGGILKNELGNALNAKTTNLSKSRNSNLSKEIRKTMMEGTWHPECVRCQTETESGMISRVNYENDTWIKRTNLTWEYLLDHTLPDGTIDTEMIDCTYYDVRFGNLCNLKCRMCGPTDSSQWYDDQAALWGTQYKDSHGIVKLVKNEKDKFVPENNVYNWHESESYWEQMDSQIPQITKLYIVGGEPLLIDRHYEFLQKCVDHGQSLKMTIEYNTNLTNIPTRAWDIWKHFKQVNIGASIDGVGDINHYMRYPSNFDQIHNNLLKLSTAEGNFTIWIAATINVFNVLHFPEFMEWILLNKISRVNDNDRRPIITPHPLHGPKFYNIRMLPKFAKDHIKEKYESYKPKLIEIINNTNWSEERKIVSRRDASGLLDQYVDYMYAKDFSDALPMFWKTTRKLDTIRGHSIEDYIPELYNLLKDTEI
jgi:sulfatase maturation enzyme AslB (radical SAM superfamily)